MNQFKNTPWPALHCWWSRSSISQNIRNVYRVQIFPRNPKDKRLRSQAKLTMRIMMKQICSHMAYTMVTAINLASLMNLAVIMNSLREIHLFHNLKLRYSNRKGIITGNCGLFAGPIAKTSAYKIKKDPHQQCLIKNCLLVWAYRHQLIKYLTIIFKSIEPRSPLIVLSIIMEETWEIWKAQLLVNLSPNLQPRKFSVTNHPEKVVNVNDYIWILSIIAID